MTFQNSVVGGVTLVRPAIQSPDYTEHVSGWTINQDGSAEFNDITIRGGTVVSGLALYYNGTPTLGNLILSIAAEAGVDEFGNAYNQGVTAYDGSGSQIILQAGSGASTISFVPRTLPGVTWQAGGMGQALSSRLGTNTPQVFMASPYDTDSAASASLSLYGNPAESNGDVRSEAILSALRTSIFSDNVWLTGQISLYNNNTFTTYAPTVTGGGTVTWTTRTGYWTRIGKMIYVVMYLVVNAAGSGATPITIDAPTNVDRTTRQRLGAYCENITAAREGAGTAMAFTGAVSPTFTRIRGRDNSNLVGADLLAGSSITIEGWYREA